MMYANLPTNSARVRTESGGGHPLGGRVGVVDPLPGGDLVGDLLQDHHFLAVVERLVDPDLADAALFEAVETVVHLAHQGGNVVDGGHRSHDHPGHVPLGGRFGQIDFLHDFAAEYRRDIFDAGNIEPLENRR